MDYMEVEQILTPLDLARFAEHAYTDGHVAFRDDVTHEFWIDHNGTSGYCCKLGDDVAVISFRGTDSLADWLDTNFRVEMVECGLGMAHKGFVTAVRGVLQDVLYFLKATQPKHIHLVGHSLGGALAVVTAQRLLGQAIPAVMTVTTFGCPRIGDETFVGTLSGIPITQYIRRGDPVPDMPPGMYGYRHAAIYQVFTTPKVNLDTLTEGHSMTQYRKDFE
jgi:predicted lipase